MIKFFLEKGKFVILFFLIVEIAMIFFAFNYLDTTQYPKETKEENQVNKEQFAMYVDNGSGNYVKYEGKEYFPGSKYTLNLEKSICSDKFGNKLENVIGQTNGKITVTSSKTAYCILYFDIVSVVYEKEFAYTGSYQEFEAPATGYYFVETYGAQGGSSILDAGTRDLSSSTSTCVVADTGKCAGGPGAYASGYIYLNVGEKLYIYVGGKGGDGVVKGTALGGYNGGGSGDNDQADNEASGGGGGSTDIRYFGNANLTASDLLWNATLGINSRIMVAAGGGGGSDVYSGIIGGSLYGEKINALGYMLYELTIPSQYSGYGFGYGQNGITATANFPVSGTGSGYYGGYIYQSTQNYDNRGGGGNSYISGFAGVNAVDSGRIHTYNTIHYSNKYFINGKMEAGVNEGDGKARITYIKEYQKADSKIYNVRYIKDCINGNTVNEYNHWLELQAISNGKNVAYGKTVTATATAGTGTENLPFTALVDGDIDSMNYIAANMGLQCVKVDLGSLYDIDEIAVWHYYSNNRSYNEHSILVSKDDVSWNAVIDNQAGVMETNLGIRYQAKYTGDYEFYLGGEHNPSYTAETESKAVILINNSNITSYCISESDSSDNCEWMNVSGNVIEVDYILSSGDGTKRAYAHLMDNNYLIYTLKDEIILKS